LTKYPLGTKRSNSRVQLTGEREYDFDILSLLYDTSLLGIAHKLMGVGDLQNPVKAEIVSICPSMEYDESLLQSNRTTLKLINFS
jgi:hypothetical protein